MEGIVEEAKPVNMQNIHTYHVEVEGWLDENSLNESGPIRTMIVRADQEATYLEIHADQSGLIGLLRFLHQQGYVLRAVDRKQSIPIR